MIHVINEFPDSCSSETHIGVVNMRKQVTGKISELKMYVNVINT